MLLCYDVGNHKDFDVYKTEKDALNRKKPVLTTKGVDARKRVKRQKRHVKISRFRRTYYSSRLL